MDKSPEAFRTISEVAEWLDVPTHVLRFWESRFTQVKPVKRAGGRRYYRPSDMELLGGIKRLLHDDGLTIRGVQKLLRDEGVRHVAGMSPPLGTGREDQAPVSDDDVIDGAYSEVSDVQSSTARPGEQDRRQPADEAPMAEDVPTLPVDTPDKVVPFSRAAIVEKPVEPEEEPAREAAEIEAGTRPIESKQATSALSGPEPEKAPEATPAPDLEAAPEPEPEPEPELPAAEEPAARVENPDVAPDPTDDDPSYAEPRFAVRHVSDEDRQRLRAAYERLAALRHRLGSPGKRPPQN